MSIGSIPRQRHLRGALSIIKDKQMRRVIVLFFCCLSLMPCFAQIDSRLIGLEKEIELIMSNYQAVGVSVAIVEQDSILYSNGFGYRDRESKLKMNSQTLLPIGSSTKSFTAALLGLLENDQVLSLKDKPSIHIPNLQFYNDKMNTLITIEDLLSHKSGLGNQDGSNTFFPTKQTADFIPRFKFLKPNGEIKNSFHYSNAGYGLSGLIIEQTTNDSWGNQIKKRIFSPLDMHRSVTDIHSMEKDNNHGIGYGLSDGKQVKLLNRIYTFSSAEGAIITSVNEISNYLITWLNKGKFKDQQVIPEDYIFEASTIKNIRPQNNMDENFYLFGYGYGWFIQSLKGNYAVEHGGNVPGFSTQVAMYPFKKIGIIVITNQNNSALPYIVEDIITNRLLELTPTPINEYPIQISEIWNRVRDIKPINEKQKPTHDLNDYCGDYGNEGYGNISIYLKDNILHIKFPQYDFVLEHQNNNNFIMRNTEEIPEVFGLPYFGLSFQINYEGKISSLSIGFQVEPVKFERKSNY